MRIFCIKVLGVVFFGCCVFLPIASAVADENGMDAPVIFRYKGQAYTAADLTLVSYAEYQKRLEETRRIYDPAKHHPPTCGISPNAEPWKTEHADEFQRFYCHQLNALIERFVAHEVYLEIKKKYNDELAQNYFDPKVVEPYIQKIAQIEQESVDAGLAAFEHTDNAKACMEFSEKIFPTRIKESTHIQGYKFMTSCYPYCRLCDLCFPTFKNGQVAPWVQWEIRAMLLQYYVQL